MARRFQRVCVYCGSSTRVAQPYLDAATALGVLLAERGVGLVYGGGSVGLMNAVADGALSAGGEVIGVIPEKLQALELGKAECTVLEVVPDMHVRKRRMAEQSDAFIAMPGGYGTLEELFEAVTWTQLGYHRKPVGLLDVDGYFDPLVTFLHKMASEGFVRPAHRGLITVRDDAEALLEALAVAEIPELESWIDQI